MPPPALIRVLIADDHLLVREGLAALLTPAAGFSLVGAACNGEEAVTLFRLHRPDVTLLDVRMPVLDGLGAAKLLRAEFRTCVLVMFSAFDASEDIYQAVRLGVKSYLCKDTPCALLLDTLRLVAAGRTYFPPHITERLMQRMSQPELTLREREILACLAEGKSNGEIGDKLFIAEGTVKSHVNKILTKMGVADRTQAAVAAIQRGLVPPP